MLKKYSGFVIGLCLLALTACIKQSISNSDTFSFEPVAENGCSADLPRTELLKSEANYKLWKSGVENDGKQRLVVSYKNIPCVLVAYQSTNDGSDEPLFYRVSQTIVPNSGVDVQGEHFALPTTDTKLAKTVIGRMLSDCLEDSVKPVCVRNINIWILENTARLKIGGPDNFSIFDFIEDKSFILRERSI